MVKQTNDIGAFTVYEARSPGGSWTEKDIPEPSPAPPRATASARAIIGHPELSTKGKLLLSYFNPAATPDY